MLFGPSKRVGGWRCGVSFALVLAAVHLQAAGVVEEIVGRLVEQSSAMATRLERWTLSYSKQSVVEHLGSDGQVQSREEWLCACRWHSGKIEMRVLSYRERDMVKEGEPAAEAAGGAAKPSAREEHPFRITPELAAKYRFTREGEEVVQGRLCHVLSFLPKEALDEHGLVDRFMNQLAGRLWVDQGEYAVVRAEVHLQAPVRIWGGVLAAVKSFRYTLERTRVGEGIWLNRSSSSEFELRKLVLSRQYRTASEWRDVRLE